MYDVSKVALFAGLAAYSSIASLVGLFMLVAMCFLFNKANEPWWAAIIPFYNLIVLLKIADKPWWWLLLFLIPIANIVLMIIMYVDLVKNFGKPGSHVLLLIFFPYVYFPYLAFSKSVKYKEGQEEAPAA